MTSIALEFFTNVFHSKTESADMSFFNPYRQFPEYRPITPPTHYTTEGGGRYSLRPDLSRSGGPGVYYTVGATALAGGAIVGAGVITGAYGDVIENQSPSEQRSLWQSFAQSLTGGFGTGSWNY